MKLRFFLLILILLISTLSCTEDSFVVSKRSQGFTTDFSKSSVDFNKILSGGVPKNGIPAIDNPKFVKSSEANSWLEDNDPVLVVKNNNQIHVYPLEILMWHEIVNDVIDDLYVSVTYCPLCNTGVAFNRKFKGDLLEFRTTGSLMFSNMLMYDEQTESWWQQATGKSIIGTYNNSTLKQVPVLNMSWVGAKRSYKNISVLSRETGYKRPYGENPYEEYDNPNSYPFLLSGIDVSNKASPLDRVIAVKVGEESKAYSYEVLKKVKVINDYLNDEKIVILWQAGTASALDSLDISDGKDIGSANAFYNEFKGKEMNFFISKEGEIKDEKTNSTWLASGLAIKGSLKGAELEPVQFLEHFWFSYYAFENDNLYSK